MMYQEMIEERPYWLQVGQVLLGNVLQAIC